jgi:uncharacterized protein (DUF1800 family)
MTTNPAAVPTTELLQQKILRETYSERQLQEVMTDFWLNHFNVFIGKNEERYLLTSYERDVIRPHALGKFEDLLIATAKSPAMMVYLDNAQSIGPDSEFAKYGPAVLRPNFNRRRRRFGAMMQEQRGFGAKKKLSGLNENYAREVMELHTLGVDGGYTQQDVTQLAQVLTGWGVTLPRTGKVEFEYHPEMHEPGTKFVLGHKIKDGGEKEGMQMLKLLAHHPSTAHFISKKLAMRFVSDDPPPALVDRMAKTFLKSDGDIREVLRTMYKSPEFWSEDAYRAKMKTPLEFVISALRGTNAEVVNAQPIADMLNRMGMPLYGMQPPTGYSMKADAWLNTAALLNRLNFALALATGRLPGVRVNAQALAPDADPQSQLSGVEAKLLDGDVSAQTHEAIERELDDPSLPERARTAQVQAAEAPTDRGVNAEDDLSLAAEAARRRPRMRDAIVPAAGPPTRTALAVGLVLGSPEFQRR